MERQCVRSRAPWEDIVGYSRAVRIGEVIEVAGTTAVIDGRVVYPNNPYEQTITILKSINKAIEELGGRSEDVTRTRMYVKDISHWEDIGKAHREFFRHTKPASTMIEVSRFIDDQMLVEIEVTAICQDGRHKP
jgi:enamine deaminase RidA (YjgF/YER057c/UK114 family)